MSAFKRIVAQLKQQEAALAKQLAGIRNAISSLEFGGGGVPLPFVKRPASTGAGGKKRKRRRFSAATIAKMRAAQKARWARIKKAG